MQHVPRPRAPSGGIRRGWRALILIFAGLLTIGLVQPTVASAARPLYVKVMDKRIVEADYGATTVSVKVVLNRKAHKRVTVGWRTVNGTAKAGSDYIAKSGRVKFRRGARVAFVHVRVMGDKDEEYREFFKVRLFDSHRARIADRVALVKIIDTDVAPPPPPAKPALWVSDTKVDEGDIAYFKVKLDKPARDVVTFRFSTSDGSATEGEDYYGRSGLQSIDKGDTWTVVKVKTIENSKYEPDHHKTFFLNVYKAYNATIEDGHGKAYIVDDDPPPKPKLVVKGDYVEEGGMIHFWVVLSEQAHYPVSFKYATEDGTAEAWKDYYPESDHAVIDKYDRSFKISVKTKDDVYDEDEEYFFLKVYDVHGADVVDGKAKGVIKDNDPEPKLSISGPATTAEGTDAELTVKLDEKSGKKVTVHFATKDDSAMASADYVEKSGTLTFSPGDTSQTITVKVNDDGAAEGQEKFFVELSNPTNATIGDGKATITIPAH